MRTFILGLMLSVMVLSCTIISPQSNLMPGVTKETPLEDVAVTITTMPFLTAGWTCLKQYDMPPYLHPIVVQIYGCSTMTILNGRVIDCDVILGVEWEWIKQHELKHCQGYDD